MNQSPVRWGILSTANIARRAFIPALKQTRRGRLVAVASRSREKAEQFARENEIPDVYDDYESLLASGRIDAVYNPLPNTMHLEWTRRAAEHGVHVFCEKPLATNPADARLMAEICRAAGVILVEAFVFLSHPQTLELRRQLDRGVIGKLLQVQSHFNFKLSRPEGNIRVDPQLGGGSLLDVGCYPITFARFAFGEEPVEVRALHRIDPDFGVDTRASILLNFRGERQAAILTGFDTPGGQGAVLYGEKGYIVIPQPFHPDPQSHFTVHTSEGSETVRFETGVLPFAPAIEQFHDCVLDGAEPLVPAAYAAGTLEVIRKILAGK